MICFSQMKADTEAKLGRQLYNSEIEFLQWVYVRYEKEQNKLNGLDCFSQT